MSPDRKPGHGVENTDRTSRESYLRRLREIPGPFAAITSTERSQVTRADERSAGRAFDFNASNDFLEELGLTPIDPEAVINFFGTRENNPLKLTHERDAGGMEHEIFIEELPKGIDKKSRIIKVSKLTPEEQIVRERIHIHEAVRLIVGEELLPEMSESDFLPSGHAFADFEFVPSIPLDEIIELKARAEEEGIIVHSFSERLRELTRHDIQLEFDAKDEKNFKLKKVKGTDDDKPHLFQSFIDNVLYNIQAQNLLDPVFLKNIKLLLNDPESHVSDKGKLLYHLRTLYALQAPPAPDEMELRLEIAQSIDDLALAA